MIQKLLFLAIVVAIVWFAAKAYQRFESVRRQAGNREKRPDDKAPDKSIPAQDMIECPRCGTYVAGPRPTNCGQADCPYPT